MRKTIIQINSRQDLYDLGTVSWEESNNLLIIGHGIFCLKNDNYPKYFEYNEPFDTHCCGTWCERTKEDYLKYLIDCQEELQQKVKNLQKKIENLQKMLDKCEDV